MIILASASPRRQEILKLITENFIVIPSDIDEGVPNNIEIEKSPEYLAVKKAKHIYENGHKNDVVIGCDTGVFIDGKMLGKPKNKEDAKQMLTELSGRKHKVITGCCICTNSKVNSFSQVTEVEFYELTEEEIESYIATGEPMDKAGAYAIQGKCAIYIDKIEGDYNNVVGLPVSRIYRELQKIGNDFYTW